MPSKIRIYELAKELGLSNKETLALTEALQIGDVKSHSSSIADAQADRVRRKAKRDGMIRDPRPQEPEISEAKTPSDNHAAAVSSATPASVATTSTVPSQASSTKQDAPDTNIPIPSKPARETALKPAPPQTPDPVPQASGLTANTEPFEGRPKEDHKRVISSSGSAAPTKRDDASSHSPQAPTPVTKKVVKKVIKKLLSDPKRQAKDGPPASQTGKPIPPPPRSVSGRSIPPPPSGRAQTSTGGRQGANKPPSGRGPAGRTPASRGPAGRGPAGRAPASKGPAGRAPAGRGPAGRGPAGRGPAGRGPAGKPSTTRPGSGTPSAGRHTTTRSPSGAPTSSRGPRPSGTPSGGSIGGGRGATATAGGGAGGTNSRGVPSGRGGPNQGRRPPRRKSRRRRNREELQPMDVPDYTPVDAPVPQCEVVIERACTAQDLGPKLNRTAADVVHFLLQAGEMLTATHSLSDDMIELFAEDIGANIRLVDPGEEQEVELQKLLEIDDNETPDGPLRPPVVTVMGHVDHGKTLLLDRIRNANVVEGEAGGITQHIGAYQVEHNNKRLTFLDTPGHEAFTAMRARGARATDIVILMVAADDGVMPQTIEAINHAKAAEVPILVAVNKIDRDNADPQKAVAGVAEHGLVPEAWGGDTIFQEVSALKSLGIEELLDHLLLLAEVEDLRSDPRGRATGVVLESNLNIGRGPVATVLVQRGTLRVGDPLVAGASWGRVRALLDDHGENVLEAGPSTPVQVLGLSNVADAGDVFVVAASEKLANRVASKREHWQRQSSLGREAHALSGGARLEDIFSQIQRGEAATLNMVVKADVNGSLEAVTESLRKLERNEVKIRFVHRGVGGITENDVALAAASNATILGFNVRPDRKARELAETEKVEVRSYEIIYKLLEDIEAAMLGMLTPEFDEVVTGEAEVREVFRVPRVGSVAGCFVLNGVIKRGSGVRFLRQGTIIWKGEISSLKRFTEDAREVAAGFECGIGLSNFQDLKQGDVIETFENRLVERSLDN